MTKQKLFPVTEGSSEFSDSDLDMSRRRSRRSQKKQVNYHETSESDGSQAETNRAKMKPRRQHESSDSEGQSKTHSGVTEPVLAGCEEVTPQLVKCSAWQKHHSG